MKDEKLSAPPKPSSSAKAAEETSATARGGATLLDKVAEESPRRPAGEVTLGRLVEIDDTGRGLVDFPHNPAGGPIPARSTLPLEAGQLGRQVALLFEEGDPRRPIVLGFLRSPEPARGSLESLPEATVDGQRLLLEAEQEIVLRCGEASITLTQAGKIILRGRYLLSRSSGTNRIKGGSVQIN